MFQAQNRETWKVSVSLKIIMTTSVTRPCFTTQRQNRKTKIKIKTKSDLFWSETGLVLRPTVSDHITDTHDLTYLTHTAGIVTGQKCAVHSRLSSMDSHA